MFQEQATVPKRIEFRRQIIPKDAPNTEGSTASGSASGPSEMASAVKPSKPPPVAAAQSQTNQNTRSDEHDKEVAMATARAGLVEKVRPTPQLDRQNNNTPPMEEQTQLKYSRKVEAARPPVASGASSPEEEGFSDFLNYLGEPSQPGASTGQDHHPGYPGGSQQQHQAVRSGLVNLLQHVGYIS